MAKEFRVQTDVTFSGDFCVMANDETDAISKVKSMQLVPSDIRNFCHIDTSIVDVEETEEL